MGIVMNISDTVTVMQPGGCWCKASRMRSATTAEVRRAYLGSMITGDSGGEHDPRRAAACMAYYGKSHILQGVSLAVRAGEMV